MPKGDPPFPLEHLAPYFRGGRYAMVSMKIRFRGDERVKEVSDRYIAMADRYVEAAKATFKLRKERSGGPQ